MSSEQSSINAETIEQTKQQIRGLVSEIAQLSKSDLQPEEYYAAFMQRIVSALAAIGGAVWLLGESRRLELAYQINISDTLLDSSSDDAAKHIRLLEHIAGNNDPQLIPPLSGASDERLGGNPTQCLLVLAPLVSDGQIEGVVEVFQRPDGQPATQRGYLRFLIQMCEMAGDWLKTRKLRHFSDRHSLWSQADHFSRLVHESLDLRETAYTITNEGQRLIGCDRVSVAIKRGGKCVVEAVSGQDTLDDRSNIVTKLGRLATRVIATGESLWYEGTTEDLPPQVEQAIEDYVDESYSKSIAVLPIRKPRSGEDGHTRLATGEAVDEDLDSREILGAIIVEQIEGHVPREMLAPRIDLVYEHSARAISNSLDHSHIFLMPVWRAIGKSTVLVKARNLPKTLTVAGIVLAVLIGLFVIPKDFTLEAAGELQPIRRREVFVEHDGVITQVLVRDQDPVKQGDVLVVTRNADLEMQYADLLGQRDAALERMNTVVKMLIKDDELSREQRGQLSGERDELKVQLASLKKQIELADVKRESLEIRSPMDGKVLLAWDVEQSLQHRPVSVGQSLMTIADPTGDWELELFMPERRMGHVTSFRSETKKADSEQDLRVSYILATDPGTYREGKVKEVRGATSLHDEEGHTVSMKVEINQDDLVEPRPGASVTADVYCGRTSLGYWLFHEAIEWVQANVLF